MSGDVSSTIRRNAWRFAMTGIVGIAVSGCADATRFSDSASPFTNPFASASANRDAVAPTPQVSTRPLASARPSSAYATAARPSPAVVASAPTPGPEATGSIHSRIEPVGGTSAGWTAVGGSPVVVGPADSSATLSARYGVPESALLSANGLHSRGEIHPDMRVVIPVFNARGGEARIAKVEENHDVAEKRHAARREADDDADTRKSDRAEAEHKKHKLEAKRDDDDSDDDSAKSKRIELKSKKHKADDADASDARPEKKTAKLEKLETEKIAKVEKIEKPAKAEKPPKPAPEVAKAEPAKLAKKEDADKRGSGDVAAAAPAGGDDSDKFRWPARGRIIQGFKSGGNDGINIALPEGTSVRAAEDGKVAYAGSALKGYGNLVLIRHINGFVTAYANNGELNVKSGDSVKRGQVIAKSGASGDVSTPQLHFELRKGQTPVDPTNYLAGL